MCASFTGHWWGRNHIVIIYCTYKWYPTMKINAQKHICRKSALVVYRVISVYHLSVYHHRPLTPLVQVWIWPQARPFVSCHSCPIEVCPESVSVHLFVHRFFSLSMRQPVSTVLSASADKMLCLIWTPVYFNVIISAKNCLEVTLSKCCGKHGHILKQVSSVHNQLHYTNNGHLDHCCIQTSLCDTCVILTHCHSQL